MNNLGSYRAGVLICLAVWVSIGPAQEEQWLQYRSAGEVSLAGINVGWHSLDIASEAPSDVEMPEFTADKPFLVKWPTPMAPAGYLWIALDRAADSGLYDRIYIDSNGDGQLKDEEAVVSHRMNQYYSYFGPLKLVFEIEDGPVTYHLNVRFYSSGDRQRFYVSSGGWYEGAITVGAKKLQCVLFDNNTNGAFDDKSLNSSQSDRIQIKEDGDSATLFVGRYLDIDDTLYSPEIAQDGAFVKLAKAEGVSYGRLRMAESITEVSVGGENGLFVLAPKQGVCSLPVGKYRIDAWTNERIDDDGKNWRVRGTGFSGNGDFDVAQDEETELEIGEPIVATLDASGNDTTHSFSHELRGKDGERIELMCNGARPRAPKLHIKNKEGTYDRTYSFAYG